jgi:two-component system invasion response regulator UvrY
MVRILVADDNPAVRHYLRSILEQKTTWQCDEARNGKETLERVHKAQPDVILLDFQMPDLNGLDVAREIGHSFPNIPILMVTVHMNKQLAIAAQAVGIRGACAKSDVGSIVDAVDALLHEKTYFPNMIPTSSIEPAKGQA